DRRGVDALDAGGGDDQADELLDGEVAGGFAEGGHRALEGLPGGSRGRLFAGLPQDALRDLDVGQREVGGAGGGDLRAAVERIGDGAQHGEEVDGGGTIEEEPRRREDVVDA